MDRPGLLTAGRGAWLVGASALAVLALLAPGAFAGASREAAPPPRGNQGGPDDYGTAGSRGCDGDGGPPALRGRTTRRRLERGTVVVLLRARHTCRVRVRAYVRGAGRRLRSRSVVRTLPGGRRGRVVVLRFGPRGRARLRAAVSRPFSLSIRYAIRVSG